jgi:hypothetical protein
MRQLGVAAVVFVLGEVGCLLLGLQLVNSPLIYGRWPPGVSESNLRAATQAGLAACTRSSDSLPSGCLQSTALPAPVRWSLAGDPLQRAGFEMVGGGSGSRHDFQVWGTYAMVAVSGPQAEASEGPFIAHLMWDGSQLRLLELRKGTFATDRPAQATDSAARQAALKSQETCTTAPSVELCPPGVASSEAWTNSGQVSYDRSTGVVHVRGKSTAGETYDAHEVLGTDGHLVCYLIRYTN